nr:hypothetical protein [Tanacetum cinerariifolium]
MKSSFQLVDEPDKEPAQLEPKPEPEYQDEGEDQDVKRAIQMSLESFQTQGQAHVGGVAIRELVSEATPPLPVRRTPATDKTLTGPSAHPQDDTFTKIVRDSLSPADAKTGVVTDKTNSEGDTKILHIDEDQGKDVDDQVNLEENATKLDQGQARSDRGKTFESQPPQEQEFVNEDQAGADPGVSHVALVGPNPKPTYKEFMTNVYLDVHGSLKFLADEHVILEEPLSSSGTLSSIKNLDDAYTIGDQFLNDKPTKYEPGKLNVDSKVVSMVTVLIHQASSSVLPLSTPIIDMYSPKPVSFTTQAQIFIATTTTTTTTLPFPPPLQQQSSTDSELAARVITLKRKFTNLKQINQNLDTTSQNLGSRVFTLELRDLDRFRELPEADMKEILHQRMFESGSYKSLPKHVALYEAFEASMEQANRDEFLAEKEKSCKRHSNDQDPPPPPLDSDPSKKRRHDSDNVNVSDSKDTNTTHRPKLKTRPDRMKSVPEEDRPATPEPFWVIPPNEFPEPKNNWANALASSYQDLKEYKLL